MKLFGKLKDGLYVLQTKTVTGEMKMISTEASKNTLLWHKWLAHISEKGLECLFKQGLIGNKKPTSLSFCEFCVLGKASRASFKTTTHITKDKLDYIHSDLWGLARITTHGGTRYFLTLIDDFSRKLWAFMLKSKEEVFDCFL